jgi:hypothetical protein
MKCATFFTIDFHFEKSDEVQIWINIKVFAIAD